MAVDTVVADLTPYARLVELARTEAELVARNAYEELAPIAQEREAIVAALPDRPPAAAGPMLAEAQAVVGATQATMATDIAATDRALGAIDSGRRVAAGYGGPIDRSSLDARG